MILQKLHAYYHYLWYLFVVIAITKLIITFIVNNEIGGFNGFLFAIFKWHGEGEQELEENANKKTIMRILNVLSLFIYIILGIIILLAVLPMFVPV